MNADEQALVNLLAEFGKHGTALRFFDRLPWQSFKI